MFKGMGVHHVAIGVRNLNEMKSFYMDTLGFNKVFLEFDDMTQEIMQDVVRAKPTSFAGIMFAQEHDGVSVELICMSNPTPRAIHSDFKYGDIGVAKVTIAVSDIEDFYKDYKDRINLFSEPKLAVIPDFGNYEFLYGRDPEGNLLEFVSNKNLRLSTGLGSICWVGISVTDLDRSVAFYQRYLGFDNIFINKHERFFGLVDEISGNRQTQVFSCVLSNSNGGGMVELFEVNQPRGRSIPFGTKWGDFGYLQVCLYCKNIDEIIGIYENEGIEFLSKLELMQDGIKEHTGSFIYLKDPDGIPLEFLFLHNI